MIIFLMAIALSSPADFHGWCRGSVMGTEFEGPCRSKDLAAPGYNNRFHLVVNADLSEVTLSDYIRVECSPRGTMRISSTLWGWIEIMPADASVRKAFSMVNAYEVRPQNLTHIPIREGVWEVLITEAYEDFNGQIPSSTWIQKHAESFRRLSRAH